MKENISIYINGKMVCYYEFLNEEDIKFFIKQLDSGSQKINWDLLRQTSLVDYKI